MASIRVRKSSKGKATYQVRYKIGQVESSVTFTNKVAAVRFKKNVETLGASDALKLLDLENRDQPVTTLDDLLKEYIAHGSEAAAGTLKDYDRYRQGLLEHGIGAYPLEILNERHVRAWVEHLQTPKKEGGAGLAAKTIRNRQGFLSAALAYGVSKGVVARNVAHKVMPRKTERPDLTLLTPPEFQDVLERLVEHWRPLAMLLYGTGMRYGEAAALKARDFDYSGKPVMVSIVRAWKHGGGIGAPKTERGRRTISLPAEAAAAVEPLLEGAEPNDLVFSEPSGLHIGGQRTFYRALQDAVAASGVGKHVRVHDLRHSHASWMLKHGGLNLQELQYRLGHESITTTVDRYGHLMPEAQVQAAKAAQLAFQPADDTAVDLAAENQRLQAQLELMMQLLQPSHANNNDNFKQVT